MDIKTFTEGQTLHVSLSGDLNTLTAPKLSDCLDEMLIGMEALCVDFAYCDYVSSAGLRVLMAALGRLKDGEDSVRLINVGENFMAVLEMTGLSEIFTVEAR